MLTEWVVVSKRQVPSCSDGLRHLHTMSIQTNTTNVNSPSITNDDQPFIGSGLLSDEEEKESTNYLTDKQRRVVLATSALYEDPEISFSKIARHADVSTTYVRQVLIKFINRHDLPAACKALHRCTPTKTYGDLTDLQRQIVHEIVVSPDQTDTEIAERFDCSISHVRLTRVIYNDIVEQKREEICS